MRLHKLLTNGRLQIWSICIAPETECKPTRSRYTPANCGAWNLPRPVQSVITNDEWSTLYTSSLVQRCSEILLTSLYRPWLSGWWWYCHPKNCVALHTHELLAVIAVMNSFHLLWRMMVCCWNLEKEATPLLLQASLHAVRRIKVDNLYMSSKWRTTKSGRPRPTTKLPSVHPNSIQFNSVHPAAENHSSNSTEFIFQSSIMPRGAQEFFVGWFCRPWITPLCQSGLENPTNPNSKLGDFTQKLAS